MKTILLWEEESREEWDFFAGTDSFWAKAIVSPVTERFKWECGTFENDVWATWSGAREYKYATGAIAACERFLVAQKLIKPVPGAGKGKRR